MKQTFAAKELEESRLSYAVPANESVFASINLMGVFENPKKVHPFELAVDRLIAWLFL